MAPADVGLGGLIGGCLFFATLQLHLVKFRLQAFEGDVLVLVLGALLLGEYDDSRWFVDQTHSTFRAVDVLAAGAGSAGKRDFHVRGLTSTSMLSSITG